MNDIARKRRPDKAKSEEFVNALCDRIQPNSSQLRAMTEPGRATGDVSPAVMIGKNALISPFQAGFGRPIILVVRGNAVRRAADAVLPRTVPAIAPECHATCFRVRLWRETSPNR
jgi:hypothetical protein